MSAKTKPMQCYDCGHKIQASIAQAKRHGWQLWVGGARCERCVEAQQRPVEEWIHGRRDIKSSNVILHPGTQDPGDTPNDPEDDPEWFPPHEWGDQ